MSLSVPHDLVPPPDLNEVRRALECLIPQGKVFELRSLPNGRSRVCRTLDDAIQALPHLTIGSGLYYTLNPVRPDLTGCANNKDITQRVNLLIDIDSIRENTDIMATEAEKAGTASVTSAVIKDLESHGCPDPVSIDTGNGYQLVYRIDLPNDDMASQWVSRLLRLLAERHNTPQAHVDISVHNAGRIARLPGTWNRKGVSSPDRPHRMAKIITIPDPFIAISLETFQAIIGPLKVPRSNAAPRLASWTVPHINGSGEVVAWYRKAMDGELAKAVMAPVGERHNALRAAARTLAGQLHHNGFSESELVRSLLLAGERAGLDDKDRNDVVEWGLENGKANPLPWPDRLARPVTPPQLLPAVVKDETFLGQSGRSYASPLIVRASDVIPKRVHWLWPERIPFGFITLIAGKTGVGKSFVVLDIAARLSNGDEIPFMGGECFEKASTLILGEDSHDYVLTPRLIEAGADLSRISFMSWETMATFCLSDIQMLDDVYYAAGSPTLIVIDPPTNFLGSTDEHKNAEVRGILMGISIWSMQHDLAVMLITHCNKGIKKDMAALDRIIGSVAWASTSRVAHVLAENPEEKKERLFLPLKSNIGEMPGGLSYRIKKTPTLAIVEWVGKVDFDADDTLSGEKKKPRGVAAVEWLADKFTERREWASDDLKREAAEAGVSKNALWSPEVQALPIRKRRITDATGEVKYHWIAQDGWPPETTRENGKAGKLGRNPNDEKIVATFPIQKHDQEIKNPDSSSFPAFLHSRSLLERKNGESSGMEAPE